MRKNIDKKDYTNDIKGIRDRKMSLEGAGSVLMNAAQKVCVIFISNPGQKPELETIRNVKIALHN